MHWSWSTQWHLLHVWAPTNWYGDWTTGHWHFIERDTDDVIARFGGHKWYSESRSTQTELLILFVGRTFHEIRLTWRFPVDALGLVCCVLLPIWLFLNFLRQRRQHLLWIERYDRLFLFPLSRPQLLLHHTILLWTVCPTCKTRMQILKNISHFRRTQKNSPTSRIENIEIDNFGYILKSQHNIFIFDVCVKILEINSYLNGKAVVFDVDCVSTDCGWRKFSSETSLYAAIYLHGQFTRCCSWQWTSHTDSQFGCTATAYTNVERCWLIHGY